MTDREKAIVMAYTGITMLNGDKFDIFHQYVEEKLGRPVFTHEMGLDLVAEEIKKAAREDFLGLCERQEDDMFYVVTSGSYSDYHICGVTRNKDYAEFLRKTRAPLWDSADIETYKDESQQEPIEDLRDLWAVDIYTNIPAKVRKIGSVKISEMIGAKIDPKPWLYPNGDFQIYVVADDEDHAIKIAQDKRAEYMAERKLELNEY